MKRLLALAAAALVVGGIATPIVSTATAAPAQAASCKSVWTGEYKRINSLTCWLSPSNPACTVKVYRTVCGGKF